MSWEIIGNLSQIWEGAVKWVVASFDVLSALWWVVVWWLLSFLWSLILFKLQRKHDERKVKVEKCLELLYNIDKILNLLILEVASWSYQDPTSNLYIYTNNKKLFDDILDLLWKSKILYFYIFGKYFNVENEIERIINSFIYQNECIEDIDNTTFVELGHRTEIKLREAKQEVENFIK